MAKNCGCALIIALICIAGCDRDALPPPLPELDAALKQADQVDIVTEGKRADIVLYSREGVVVWLRHSTALEAATVAYVEPGKRPAAIYAFSGVKCLCAIPVAVTMQPYVPFVYPLEAGRILIGSYEFGDPHAITAGRFEYTANFHLLDSVSCRQVLSLKFEALQYEVGHWPTVSELRPFIAPDGRLFIARIAWLASGSGEQATLTASLRDAHVWNPTKEVFEKTE